MRTSRQTQEMNFRLLIPTEIITVLLPATGDLKVAVSLLSACVL